VRGTPPRRSAPRSWSTELKARRAGTTLFDAKRSRVHARVQFGSWPHNPAIDLAVKLDGATAPTSTRHAREPLDADILAVLHGMKDFAPKPLPVRLREWQAAGGRLEIQSARLAQGETLANATGRSR
jgi:hypothetical protein